MLTAAQIAAYQRNGFLVVEDVVPPPLRARLAAEYAGVIDPLARAHGLAPEGCFLDTLRTVHGAGVDWFQHLDITLPGSVIAPDTPFHYGPAVHDLITCPAILDIVECLLGPDLTSNPIQHVRIKPPAHSVAADAPVHTTVTAWHQDRGVAHAEADATPMVTVWVAMTDVGPQNSCLMAQPLRKGQAMLPHCPLDQTAIPAAFLDLGHAVPLPVRAGGVVLLDPMTPHGAGPNLTEDLRWSFDLRYQPTGWPTGRSHFPDFPVRGAGRVPDWAEVRDMWRAARAASARAPHIPIHRWTSASPYCA